ncbi:MAG: nucleoside monophosphate kinase [Patescibacteria group bacterium]|nr:nucleoside monophosphate kinase [Patescibacteria group bacterium]
MTNKLPIIIFFGDPGAGKGTQAEILAEKLNFKRISTGDLIRAEMKAKSRLAERIKPFYNAGKPAPNKIVDQLVEKRIKELTTDKELKGIVFDTFPFDDEQSAFLDLITPKYNLDLPIIFWIDVPDEEILKRLGGRLICTKCNKIYREVELVENAKCSSCGGDLAKRADDNEKTIKQRIAVYKKAEAEHRDYYKKLKNWFDINGDQPVDGVSAEIWFHLKPLIKF